MYGDASIVHLAPGVVALERERALADLLQRRRQPGDCAFGLEVVHHQRVVHVDADARPLHAELQREPLVVARQRLVGIADAVEAAGLLVLDVGGTAVAGEVRLVVVHLHLEALHRPAAVLPRGVEEDAGVGAGVGPDLELGLEVGELRVRDGPDVEEMRALACNGERAVLHRPRVRVLRGLPAGQRRAIEQRLPCRLLGCRRARPGCARHHDGPEGQPDDRSPHAL